MATIRRRHVRMATRSPPLPIKTSTETLDPVSIIPPRSPSPPSPLDRLNLMRSCGDRYLVSVFAATDVSDVREHILEIHHGQLHPS